MANYEISGIGALSGKAALADISHRVAALEELARRLAALEQAGRRLAEESADNPLARRRVSSDNPGVATATALPLAPNGSFHLELAHLARAHHVVSDLMPADRGVIPAGTYRFALGVGERQAAIDLVVAPDDANAAVLETLAGAIEAAGVGAHAWVAAVPGERGLNQVRLHLLSRSTGTRSALFTADLARNLMVLIGLSASGHATDRNGGTLEQPADAEFYLDGRQEMAPGNRVYLTQLRLFLALHSPGVATLDVAPDARAVVPAVVEWAESLAAAAESAKNRMVCAVLEPSLDFGHALAEMLPELHECGIQDSYQASADAVEEAVEAQGDAFMRRLLAPETGLVARLDYGASKASADIARAIAALARQADWYRSVPDALTARRLARQAIASYVPGLPLPRASGGAE